MGTWDGLRGCARAAGLALTVSWYLSSVVKAEEIPAKATTQAKSEERDGQRDFDFLFGKWKVHNRKLMHPLAGLNDWSEFDGTLVARSIWEGRANMDEYEAMTPTGKIDGMTVRTYTAKSHQWSIYWTNSKAGVFLLPATVGKFKDGRGEFFDQEDFNGQNIFVRFVWTHPTADTARWEQAFSTDGGKTWETNWIMTYERVKE